MARSHADAPWGVYLLHKQNPNPEHVNTKGSRLTYVGMTNDLQARLRSHNLQRVRATRGSTWFILAWCPCTSKKVARMLEAWLKTGDTRGKRNRFAAVLTYPAPPSGAQCDWFERMARAWWEQRQIRKDYLLPATEDTPNWQEPMEQDDEQVTCNG